MASISTDANGNRTIQFVGSDKKRRSIRLGSVNKKVAEGIKVRVETLNAVAITRTPLDSDTATWLASIGDDLAAKLASVGLMAARESYSLGVFCDAFLVRERADKKPSTVIHTRQVTIDLIRFFGREKNLRDISEADADRYRTEYLTRGLASATAARRLRCVGRLMRHAVRMKYIPANPFIGVRVQAGKQYTRLHYISISDTHKLLAVAKPHWRILIALARFAGLRTPSESLSLKWEHIDFANGRMTVQSPKTEHLEGRACRVVPIFAHLKPILDEAREQAKPGAVHVVDTEYREAAEQGNGWKDSNMRTTLGKIIRRAGLESWPRPFHNLRASCETDLMQTHPIHVVTAWLGNTPRIAIGHYLQTLEADFAKAIRGSGAESGAVVVQNAVQTASGSLRQETTSPAQTAVTLDFRRMLAETAANCTIEQVGREGVEPTSNPL